MDLSKRFLQHVRDRRLLPRNGHVLVACSGGADSVALAVLVVEHMSQLELADVVLAHLDHGLREDSAADLESVRVLAETLGVPFHGERREVATAAAGTSPEEEARDARYAFLADAARIHGSSQVVTAHHADDQAETVLQRVLRGTGPAGLAGIPERRPLASGADTEVVRPLLPFRRAELRELLRTRVIAWTEDPTNQHGNERARLRRLGIPALAECVRRDPIPLLARLAANVAESQGVGGDDVAREFVTRQAGEIHLHTGFERLPRAAQARMLRAAAPDLRDGTTLTRAELERLLAGLGGEDGERVAGVELLRQPTGWRLRPAEAQRAEPPPAPSAIPALAPGVTELWDGLTLDIAIAVSSNAPFLQRLANADRSLEIADADRLEGELIARARREGDRIQPLGAAHATRLGHVMQRRGVPAPSRDRTPLICDESGIVWVVGVCLADRVRVRADTRRIATLTTRTSQPR